MTFEEIAREYMPFKIMDDGSINGVMDFLFTSALVVGITETGYRTRFCYGSRPEAEAALDAWNGLGDPPGDWIKETSLSGSRYNPNFDWRGENL